MITEWLKLTETRSLNFEIALETDSGGRIWFASGGKLKQHLMQGTLNQEEDDSIFDFPRVTYVQRRQQLPQP
jgi:hypothetical protein